MSETSDTRLCPVTPMTFWTALLAVAILAAALPAQAGLVVRDLGSRAENAYTLDPVRVPILQTTFGTGGNTSVRNNGPKELRNHWKNDREDGYYQRNRDLGQVFTAETTFKLDAIVLRTGPDDGAVRAGAPGAPVFLQFFQVKGIPKINDNGTPRPPAEHGWNMKLARLDDYIEGVHYSSMAVIEGGTFPDLPVTENGGKAGRRRWMRWDLTEEHDGMVFEAGKRYAFMVGFSEEGNTSGPSRAFTLLNDNSAAASSAEPSLTDKANPYPGGWGIRREGDGTLPPWRWTVDGIDKGSEQDPAANSRALEKPPTDSRHHGEALRQSRFPAGTAHYGVTPSSDGWPDVDTYRDHVFYLEITPDYSLNAVKDACVAGGSEAGKVQETGRLAARTDKSRKTWIAFDLSEIAAQEVIRSAEIVLTPDDDLHNVRPHSKLEVYGMTDEALDGWDEATLTFTNAPGNDTFHGWALDPEVTTLLGSTEVPLITPDQVGHGTVRIELETGFFNELSKDLATVIVVMKDTEDPEKDRSTAWFHSKEGGIAPALNLNVQ